MAQGAVADPADEANDALDTLAIQNDIVSKLLATWGQATDELEDGDDVDTRWQRGSAVKLLLQHLAIREEAKGSVSRRLAEVGKDDLGAKLEGDGPRRREAISALDESTRGHQAITLNTPDVDEPVITLRRIVEPEMAAESDGLLAEAAQILGEPGDRGLPSAKYVRTHSPTHPNPIPKWYDKVGPLKALRTLYDHLRGSPCGGTAPAVDAGREHTPRARP